jgi:hypothetical protein
LPSSSASVFREQGDDQGNRAIAARPIMAWRAASPSSPAPSARRYAALGLDRSLQPSKLSDHAFDASISMDTTTSLNPPSQKSHTQTI